MSKITILTASPSKDAALKGLGEYYLKLSRPHVSIDCVHYGQAKLKGNGEQDIERGLLQEAGWIEKNLSPRGHTFLLSERGPTHSTDKLVSLMKTWLEKHDKLQFVIGSAYGLHSSLYLPERSTLSLSPLTFPHELSLVIFLEQLYRLMTIMSGKRYHY